MKTKLLLYLFVLVVAAAPEGLAQPWPAELRIQRLPARPIQLELFGDLGSDYAIEAADDPGTNGWSSLVTLSLTGNSQTWLDSGWCGRPRRFYRAITFTGPAPVESAPSFRLIDHLGKSRELNYHWNDTNVAAFVLLFTADGCASVRHFAPALAALRSQFEPQKIRFWLIDSSSLDSRSNLVAEAAALGLGLPILHDRAQLVARAYRATTAPEVIGVSRGEFDWNVFYRGAIDDRKDTNTVATTQDYLADALTQFLANGTVTPRRTQPDGCALPLPPQPPVSYTTDIAPLLQRSCVRCHSPGNIGPFAMTSYDLVQSHAADIRYHVMAGHMPPWHADPEYGVFTNDFSLKATEAAKLVQWIDEGALRGEGSDPLADTPPPPATDWPAELGPPDLVLTVPQFNIPATGTVAYQYFNVTNSIPTNVWLRAAVIRPGNKRVVHHTFVWLGSQNDVSPDSLVTEYLPGLDPAPWPANTGKLLPGRTNITVQVHYTPVGQAQTDQHQLGLWFLPAAPANTYLSHEEYFENFLIPPFAQEYEPPVQEFTLTRSILLYEMRPHMHVRGKRMKYEAVYADGTSEILISVPHYHFHWQRLYRLAEPKYLSRGTKLRISGAFDNSTQNLDNPDPARSVAYGAQSTDEMFIGYYKYVAVPTRLLITAHPQSRNVARGANATLSVAAISDYPPITYQWRLNDSALPGGTSASFTITNAQADDIGQYTVLVADTQGTLTSRPAFVDVGDPSVITQPPVDQTVSVGGNATFSATVTGTPPYGFSWRKGSTVLTNLLQSETTSTFTLFNARTNDAGNYRVVVTNAFKTTGVASPLVTLTVAVP